MVMMCFIHYISECLNMLYIMQQYLPLLYNYAHIIV